MILDKAWPTPLLPDPNEEPEGDQVPGRLLQPAGGDPEEHVSQAVRVGDDQLQPQQPHSDIQIGLHTSI